MHIFLRKFRKLVKSPKLFFADSRLIKKQDKAKNEQTTSLTPIADAKNKPVISYDGLENYFLCGANWLSVDEKEIVFAFNISFWKRDCIAKYCDNYRIAFVKANISVKTILKKAQELNVKTFIHWGVLENSEIIAYVKKKNIHVEYIEDGFIRSVDLGSKKILPLSLVVDSVGIYFDATRPSQIEKIINNTCFEKYPHAMHIAEKLIHIIKEYHISKYNFVKRAINNPFKDKDWTKKRILILGQVEKDKSLIYGLSTISELEMLELVKNENPGEEIYYRPHPQVFAELSKEQKEKIKNFAEILPNELTLEDVFKHVNHVYTRTSLSGLEALIYGLEVTCLGAPFYSGWGLTDDRVKVERRKRELTLQELVCATYLLYPKYNYNLDDSVEGCLTTVLIILTELYQMSLDKIKYENYNDMSLNNYHYLQLRKFLLTETMAKPLVKL